MSAPRPKPGAPEAGDARRCATCGKPQDARFKPFCSRRCADIDLGRWLKGSYAIPAEEPPDGEPDEGEGG